MFNVIYLSTFEICSLLTATATKSKLYPHKYFSPHDITIIKECESILAVVTADTEFAETLRHLKNKPYNNEDSFTPAIRCNIIDYADYSDKISLNELISRYGEQI